VPNDLDHRQAEVRDGDGLTHRGRRSGRAGSSRRLGSG
jgi:hypothetical protein